MSALLIADLIVRSSRGDLSTSARRFLAAAIPCCVHPAEASR